MIGYLYFIGCLYSGLPGYNAYRALCGLPRAEYFRDLLDIISPAVSALIYCMMEQTLYNSWIYS